MPEGNSKHSNATEGTYSTSVAVSFGEQSFPRKACPELAEGQAFRGNDCSHRPARKLAFPQMTPAPGVALKITMLYNPFRTVAVEACTARSTGCGRPYAARERGPAFKKTSREALAQTGESCLVRNRTQNLNHLHQVPKLQTSRQMRRSHPRNGFGGLQEGRLGKCHRRRKA